jgi:hypothetical protein
MKPPEIMMFAAYGLLLSHGQDLPTWRRRTTGREGLDFIPAV